MASAFKTFYQGQLPDAAAVLATVPPDKSWIIKHVSLINADTGSFHVWSLYRNGLTAGELWTPPNGVIPAGGMAEFTGTLALEAGSTLGGLADAAAAISIVIDGDEISA